MQLQEAFLIQLAAVHDAAAHVLRLLCMELLEWWQNFLLWKRQGQGEAKGKKGCALQEEYELQGEVRVQPE